MKKSLLLCAVLFTPALHAGYCEHQRELDQVLDLSGSETLMVNAAAGDLEITAGSGSVAVIRGTVCVSEEKWLDDARVVTEGGKNAEITVDLPETSGWSITGGTYAYIDLELEVPADIALVVKDSSGDADISGVASLDVSDSSGDLEISDVAGVVVIRDSSGDIELEDIRGDVIVASDSSGDIEGDRIEGNVLIEQDSSGGIHFSGVGENFTVEKDSSGDIFAEDVGGDFTVLRDGSGGIKSRNVSGKVSTPEKS